MFALAVGLQLTATSAILSAVMAAPEPAPLLLSLDEVARCLGASISTVMRLEKRGELPRVKLGRLVRFRLIDVAALIEQHSENDRRPWANGAVSQSRPEGAAGHEPP